MAVALPQYSDVRPFAPPPGIVEEKIDPQSQQVATAYCPTTREDYFIAGTEPTITCQLHPAPTVVQSAASKLFSFFHLAPQHPAPPSTALANRESERPAAARVSRQAQARLPKAPAAAPKDKRHRGFFARLFGLGKKHSHR